MKTLQIELTAKNSERAIGLAQTTGKTPDELVNEIFDKYSVDSDSTPKNARELAFGMLRGQIWMAEDFNAPLSDEELKEWEK